MLIPKHDFERKGSKNTIGVAKKKRSSFSWNDWAKTQFVRPTHDFERRGSKSTIGVAKKNVENGAKIWAKKSILWGRRGSRREAIQKESKTTDFKAKANRPLFSQN